jgi:hypothetical protein
MCTLSTGKSHKGFVVIHREIELPAGVTDWLAPSFAYECCGRSRCTFDHFRKGQGLAVFYILGVIGQAVERSLRRSRAQFESLAQQLRLCLQGLPVFVDGAAKSTLNVD